MQPVEENERIEYYKRILGAEPEADTSLDQAELAIRLLFGEARGLEKVLRPKYASGILGTRAQLFAILQIIHIFDDENSLIRQLCFVLNHVKFLDKKLKNPKEKWFIAYSCFWEKISEIFEEQANFLSSEHHKFFENILLSDTEIKEADELVKILREKELSVLRLEKLIGLEALKRFWHINKFRAKLINWNCEKIVFRTYIN